MQRGAQNISVAIWRGQADGGYRSYELPLEPDQTVLDLVTTVQRRLDATLAYRFACRVGMCGSCAMTVNGRPRWTCRTLVRDVIDRDKLTLAPLKNMPIIRDLVADMAEFFDKWQRAKGRFAASQPAGDFAAIVPNDKKRREVDAAIECINCGVCYAACDVVTMSPDYLGPAALNRAWTLLNDVRDDADEERLRAVAGGNGCFNCHTRQRCAAFCPKQLNPTASIAGLKRAVAAAALKGKV